MSDTDAARIGDVKDGFIAARSDTNTRMKRDGSNVNMTSGQAAAFRAAIGAGTGGGTGDVVGPASSTMNALAQFADTTGKLLKDGPMIGGTTAGSLPTRADADARYQFKDDGLSALAALTTPGLYYLSAIDVWSPVTVGSGLSFTAGTLAATGGGGGAGDVVGPASATADAPAVFNGTTGKLIKVGAFPVLSVAGLTGAITGPGLKTALALAKGDVGLGNVDNTSDANKPVSTAQQAALGLKAAISDTIVSVSASRGLTAADNGKVLEVNSATAITLTVPSTLAATFNCIVAQIGAGQVTIAAGAGASVNAFGGAKTAGQWAELSVRVRGSAGAAVVSGGVA